MSDASITSPAFGVLLVGHVAAALVGFGALGATGMQGWRLGRTRDPERVAALRRYFRPGVNWAARCIYLVPVFGVALVAASGGTYRVGDPFVEVGLGLWVVAVLAAELVVWPAERQVQQALAAEPAAVPGSPVPGPPVSGSPVPGPRVSGSPVAGSPVSGPVVPGTALARSCRQLAASVPVVVVLFAGAVAVMAARP